MKASIIGFFVVISLIFGMMAFPYLTSDMATITVTDKERIVTGSGSKYLVFTENEVFENIDSIIYAKFNSSDLQGKLKRGQTYTVKVYGWRIPFLSSYRNIVSIK